MDDKKIDRYLNIAFLTVLYTGIILLLVGINVCSIKVPKKWVYTKYDSGPCLYGEGLKKWKQKNGLD